MGDPGLGPWSAIGSYPPDQHGTYEVLAGGKIGGYADGSVKGGDVRDRHQPRHGSRRPARRRRLHRRGQLLPRAGRRTRTARTGERPAGGWAMVGAMELRQALIAKTLRVPAGTGAAGDGTPVARQLDAALLDVGFSASRELLDHIVHPGPRTALDAATTWRRCASWSATTCAQRLLHRLPGDVPDTIEFWADGLREALRTRDGGQRRRRSCATARAGQPARPADLRALPAHLRGAAGRARRADRRGG